VSRATYVVDLPPNVGGLNCTILKLKCKVSKNC
jgi:hypothetical protein